MSYLTVGQAARMYRINGCIDYGYETRDGSWLLLGAGTGLMMASMDHLPGHQYCMDTDILRPDEWERMPDWLRLMERACGRVSACGWFSRYENGLKMIELLEVLRVKPLVYFGSYERPDLLSGFQVASHFAEFVEMASEL